MEKLNKFKAFLKRLSDKIEAELKYFMPSSRERYDSTDKGRIHSEYKQDDEGDCSCGHKH